ncbi:holin [Virgibacillus halodenitrificans]|uniref:Holin n=1 Tax=Virgibacillus halodenitrificans TaxID=1482 RepID=A0AAC9NN51_VIRHA|nr:holin [Virgibacillus halodenitrificans]APC50259.1 holin [Virgibacillus halodenitrificans]
MQQVLIFATLIVPAVIGLVELVKRTVSVKKNIVPAISFIIGLIIGTAAYPFTDMELVLRLWAGGFAGLSGTGLFELIKKRNGVTK